MKKLLLAVGILFVISCTKENNRTSNDCKDCTYSSYNLTTKTIEEVYTYNDWLNDPYKQAPTFCKWLDTLKVAYPGDITHTGDSIIYSCR